MEYAALAAFFDRLEQTTKRLERTAILVEILDALAASDFTAAVRLLQGKVAPDWEGIELGLAEKMVLRALAQATSTGKGRAREKGGKTLEAVIEAYHGAGDLGEAARRLIQESSRQQATLFGPEPLSVQDAFGRLLEIATVKEGTGSQEKKLTRLTKLLTDASGDEAKYLIRTVAGRLRLGVADMTFLDALAAWHLGRGVRSVQDMETQERSEHEAVRTALEHAYDLCSDLARVAQTLADGGLDAVETINVQHGTPLRPMAAERLKTLGEILAKHGGRSALEYKYDGLRIQAHVADGVRLFSRRMEELTDQFPDVQAALAEAFQGKMVIVEGECVAMDRDTGRMRPFQDISRRRGRKTGLGEDARTESSLTGGGTSASTLMDEVPVTVFLFDCLAQDGASVMVDTYADRRARLGRLFCETEAVSISRSEVAKDEAAMEAFFQQAIQDGAEGIMCKALDAPYKAGNRGFDWIKFKTDYTELVDTMDLVVVGAFFGRGRRAGWYGALLMACRGQETFPTVCKLGTGFDDATLMSLREMLEQHKVEARPPEVETDLEADVWFRPAVVAEVQAAELTLSPVHKAALGEYRTGAGLAARFPRFARWRDDKGPQEATTVEELKSMYEGQGPAGT